MRTRASAVVLVLATSIQVHAQKFIYGNEQRASWLTETSPDYRHAPPEAVERWKDRKFGLRIHWGLYSMVGSDASWALPPSSPEFRSIYGTLYQFFNPSDFDADQWTDLMTQAGIKYFTFTTKHHDGFSMYATKTVRPSLRLAPKDVRSGIRHYEKCLIPYSIMDTPFGRDVLSELAASAHRKSLGISLYFSHIDWQDDAYGWDPNNFHYDPRFTKQSDPARWAKFVQQERDQVRELLSGYGAIDACEFDIGWPKEAAEDIAGVARLARKLQPSALLRNRGIGVYGDFYTPEREIPPGFNRDSPWQAIYPGGEAFSYFPNDIYKPAEWIIDTLVDVVAKGGNFEVGYGPMPNGTWQKPVVERLREVGKWLEVNGEAIYATRPFSDFKEGDNVRFTSSKDGETLYLITLKWPDRELRTKSAKLSKGDEITMLGVPGKVMWRPEGDQAVISVPRPSTKPCDYAWVFRIRRARH